MEIVDLLEKNYSKGFTRWNEISGRGSRGGEPHMGSHTWPTFNDAILTFVEDEFVDNIMNDLNELDTKTEELGLRAFSWKIDKSIYNMLKKSCKFLQLFLFLLQNNVFLY